MPEDVMLMSLLENRSNKSVPNPTTVTNTPTHYSFLRFCATENSGYINVTLYPSNNWNSTIVRQVFGNRRDEIKAHRNQQVYDFLSRGANAWFEKRTVEYYRVVQDLCDITSGRHNNHTNEMNNNRTLPRSFWRNVFTEDIPPSASDVTCVEDDGTVGSVFANDVHCQIPIQTPTMAPTLFPSCAPSTVPTVITSLHPSQFPTELPTRRLSKSPTEYSSQYWHDTCCYDHIPMGMTWLLPLVPGSRLYSGNVVCLRYRVEINQVVTRMEGVNNHSFQTTIGLTQ